jgi:hypothetical protein
MQQKLSPPKNLHRRQFTSTEPYKVLGFIRSTKFLLCDAFIPRWIILHLICIALAIFLAVTGFSQNWSYLSLVFDTTSIPNSHQYAWDTILNVPFLVVFIFSIEKLI